SARVVGITGSMGKTSTKDLLAALCAPSARTIANEGNFNNEIGVPLTLCRLEPDSEVCILELAMRGLGQIAELCEIARPDIGVSFNFVAEHQAENAAAALAALDALGLPRPERVDVDFSRWRGEERELPGGGLLINDAYNANPVSMRAALGYLASRAGDRRRVAILGDMAELGRTAPAYHREVGEAAAELGVGELLAVGELARGYVEGAAGVPSRWTPNVHEAL